MNETVLAVNNFLWSDAALIIINGLTDQIISIDEFSHHEDFDRDGPTNTTWILRIFIMENGIEQMLEYERYVNWHWPIGNNDPYELTYQGPNYPHPLDEDINDQMDFEPDEENDQPMDWELNNEEIHNMEQFNNPPPNMDIDALHQHQLEEINNPPMEVEVAPEHWPEHLLRPLPAFTLEPGWVALNDDHQNGP